MNKKNINLKINKRISENNLNYILDQSNENQRKEEFERLITQLKNNIKSEIYNIIDTMKILKKINDKRLYLEGAEDGGGAGSSIGWPGPSSGPPGGHCGQAGTAGPKGGGCTL